MPGERRYEGRDNPPRRRGSSRGREIPRGGERPPSREGSRGAVGPPDRDRPSGGESSTDRDRPSGGESSTDRVRPSGHESSADRESAPAVESAADLQITRDLVARQREITRRREDARRRRRAARRRRNALVWGVFGCVVAGVVLVVLFATGGGSGSGGASQPQKNAAHKTRPKPPPQLPRGGRTILPGHRVVAYYGIVGTTNILGRTNNPNADAEGVERQARAYAKFGEPVLPAFELVTTIASPYPGPQGTYSSPVDPSTVARYLAAARRHKLLLILDFQPGRGEFLPEVKRYARFLRDPAVGVGLDPEWKLGPTELPDQELGSASAASINAVSNYLSRFVAKHRLPQKLFIIHEFRLSELPDRNKILIRPGLATVLQMDGLGTVKTKLESFRQVTRHAKHFQIGFKVFLRHVDDPVTMTPKQVMKLHPQPAYISYQ